MVRNGIVDKLTGWATAQAVCAALVGRATTGEGRSVEVCMLDVNVATLWPDGMMNHTVLHPVNERPDIANGFRLWPTLDGHISFIALTARQVEGIRATFELDETESRPPERPDRRGVPTRRPGDGGAHDRGGAGAAGRSRRPRFTGRLDETRCMRRPRSSPTITVEEFEHPVLGTIRQPAPPVR